MADLLQVDNVSAGYGEAVVLTGVSFVLGEGQTLALLVCNCTGCRRMSVRPPVSAGCRRNATSSNR